MIFKIFDTYQSKKPADEGKEGEDLAGRKGLPIGSPTLAHL